MPFQRVPNTAEIVIKYLWDAQNVVNTFYAQKAGGYVQSDLDDLSAAVDLWVNDEWLPVLSNNIFYSSTVVRGLDEEFDLISENSTSAGAGAISGDAVPNNVTLSVKRRSNFTGRGARGRIFIPGIPEDAVTAENTISSAYAIAYEAALNALEAAFSSASFTGVIVHRVSAGVPLLEAVVFSLIEYVVIDRTIDSMRRRLPGRGT